MIRAFMTALVAVFLCLPSAAAGQCLTVDTLYENYSAAGARVERVPQADLKQFLLSLTSVTGHHYSDVESAFAVETSLGIEVGLQVNGCLLPPIVILDMSPGNGA